MFPSFPSMESLLDLRRRQGSKTSSSKLCFLQLAVPPTGINRTGEVRVKYSGNLDTLFVYSCSTTFFYLLLSMHADAHWIVSHCR
jgi:hypothetical protein